MPPKRKRANKKKTGAAAPGKRMEKGATPGKIPKTLYNQYVPDISRALLKYGIRGNQTTSTSFGISALAADDVRDPGLVLDNKSAIGFSGYMANYTNFYVLGSTIEIKCSHGSTASGVGATAVQSTVGVFPSVGASSANDVASAEAQPGCKWVVFDIGGMKTLRQTVSCPELGGVSKAQFIADTTNWGTSTTSPAVYLWSFWNISSAAQTGVDIIMDITITYDVVFFRRRSLDITFDAQLMQLILQREAREAKARAEPKLPALVADAVGDTPVVRQKVLPLSVEESKVDRVPDTPSTRPKGWTLLKQRQA